MPHSFIAYIDEAGDEGFAFNKGSSQWFVLAALILRAGNEPDSVKLVDRAREVFARPREYVLHFKKLKHQQRVYLVGEIAKLPARLVCVCIHKPSLTAQETFGERYRLYYYGTRYLLERISWLGRDHKKPSDGTNGLVELIFSNRSGMSYEELRAYLSHLREKTGPLSVTIDWDVISENSVSAFNPSKRMGLQLADAVASSVFKALEVDAFGYTEPRYAQMLTAKYYRHRGNIKGYGIKLWPRQTEVHTDLGQSLDWLTNL